MTDYGAYEYYPEFCEFIRNGIGPYEGHCYHCDLQLLPPKYERNLMSNTPVEPAEPESGADDLARKLQAVLQMQAELDLEIEDYAPAAD